MKTAMVRYYFALFLTQLTCGLFAQAPDSLSTRILDEIVFEGAKPEGDTIQDFYRANTSATTEHILSRMKGVSLIRRGPYGQEPVFRSMQGGQLNVTIDGMKIFGACTDKMDPVTIYIEPQNLSAIQVLPGTAGAAFGSTFGGTFNLKLAEPVVRDRAVTGRTGADYQSAANSLSYFGHVNISAKKSAYRVSTTWRKSDDYRTGGGETIPHSQYTKANLGAAAKWTLGSADSLKADILLDYGKNIGFPALPMDVAEATAAIFSASYQRTRPWLVFHHLSAKIYHNIISHRMDDGLRKDVIMPMTMPGRSRTTGAFAEGEVHLLRHQRTALKAEYFYNSLLGEMTMYPPGGEPMYMQTAPLAGRQNGALFVSQQVRISDKHKTGLSLRGDLIRDHLHSGTGAQQWEVFSPDVPQTSINFAGTISMLHTFKLRENVSLEFQGGYGERPATLNERYGFYLFNRFDGYDYLGNPSLENETSWTTEATLTYFGLNIECQISPFYQRIHQYIMGTTQDAFAAMTPGARGVKQYTNHSWAELKGVDAMLLARPLPAMHAIMTVKYTHGTTSAGEALPLIPPLRSVVSLRYDLRRIHFQADWDHASRQGRVNDLTGEQPTAAWHTLSARTGWKINSFFRCDAGVENIFDRRYREHLDWGGIPRQGRNVYVNVNYTF